MHKTLTLNIVNALYYEKSNLSFGQILASLHQRDAGFDAIAIFEIKRNEELIDVKEISTAIHKTPPTLDADIAFDDAIELKAGKYRFMQMPLIEDLNLHLQLLPFIEDRNECTVYVRIFKESILEEVMQFMMPL